MVGIEGGSQRIAADGVGILLVALDAGRDLRPDPLDRLGIETRAGQRQFEETRRLVAIGGKGRQRAGETVEASTEGKLDRIFVELGLEGLAVEVAGTLVEKAGHEV